MGYQSCLYFETKVTGGADLRKSEAEKSTSTAPSVIQRIPSSLSIICIIFSLETIIHNVAACSSHPYFPVLGHDFPFLSQNFRFSLNNLDGAPNCVTG
jgi:hypothetical protein